MNQTNVVTQSTKSIPVSPYSNTPQPKTIPSAQHPIKKALDKQFPKPKPVTTLEEAEELLRNCQECAKEVNGASKSLRRAVYEGLYGGAPEVLDMSPKDFCSKVSSVVLSSRSHIDRQCKAGRMDWEFKLPPGATPEYALRTCRTMALVDNWGAVLAHALKQMGSHQKITAKSIEAAARELGCLKPRADNASPAKGGESVGDGEENRESQDTSNQQQEAATKTRSNETETKEEVVQAWLEKLMNLQLGLEKLLKKHGIQPAQILKVVALVKDQYQQLDDLLSEIG